MSNQAVEDSEQLLKMHALSERSWSEKSMEVMIPTWGYFGKGKLETVKESVAAGDEEGSKKDEQAGPCDFRAVKTPCVML